MKGFIEVHEFESGYKILIAIGNISFVKYECDEKEKCCCKIGLLVGLRGVWVAVQETYDEVKSLIAEAQREVDLKDYIPKKKLEEWMESKREKMESGESFDSYLFNMLSVFITDLNMFLKKEGE